MRTIRRLLPALLLVGCHPSSDKQIDRCLEGTIATASGCAPLPGWDPRNQDAGPRDTGTVVSDPPDSGPEPDAGVEPVDAGPPDLGVVDAGPPPLSLGGTWAVQLINVQVVESPFIEPQEVTFVGLSLVRLDDDLAVDTQHCAYEQTPFGNLQTTWPPPAIAAIDTVLQTATTTATPVVGGGIAFHRTQLVGWVSADDPVDDELPESVNDPRVIDADNDNNPGVTLEVTGNLEGSIYVVSRSSVALTGVIESADRIEGPSLTDQQQRVLDSDNNLLGFGTTTSQAVPNLSRFTMVRLSENANCQTLLDNRDALFPAN